MSTHNIGFNEELTKIYVNYPQIRNSTVVSDYVICIAKEGNLSLCHTAASLSQSYRGYT